jgi:hypothetical protein
MAKSWRPPFDDSGIIWEQVKFDRSDTEAIIEKVDKPIEDFFLNAEDRTDPVAALASSLNQLWNEYIFNQAKQSAPTPKQLKKQADKIAKLAANLLDACTIDGQIRHGLGSGGLWAVAASEAEGRGKDAVYASLKGVDSLRRWAEAVAERQSRIAAIEPAPTAKDEAFDKLLEGLGNTYRRFWSKVDTENWTITKPGTSRPSGGGEAGGPFMRFLQGVTDHMDLNKTPDALDQAWRRLQKQNGQVQSE